MLYILSPMSLWGVVHNAKQGDIVFSHIDPIPSYIASYFDKKHITTKVVDKVPDEKYIESNDICLINRQYPSESEFSRLVKQTNLFISEENLSLILSLDLINPMFYTYSDTYISVESEKAITSRGTLTRTTQQLFPENTLFLGNPNRNNCTNNASFKFFNLHNDVDYRDCKNLPIVQYVGRPFANIRYRRSIVNEFLYGKSTLLTYTNTDADKMLPPCKLLVISYPGLAQGLARQALIMKTPIIYDRTDKWDSFLDGRFIEDESFIIKNASLIFCSSVSLFNTLPFNVRKHSFLIPNGCNYTAFQKDIAKHERKTAVYMGNSSSKISLDFLVDLAKKNPDWDVDVYSDENVINETLKLPENIFYKGIIDETHVSEELQRCHVGLISFTASDWTASMLPLKLFQYISARIPTYYFNCPECKNYPEVAFDSQEYTLDEVYNKKISDETYTKLKMDSIWEVKLHRALDIYHNSLRKKGKDVQIIHYVSGYDCNYHPKIHYRRNILNRYIQGCFKTTLTVEPSGGDISYESCLNCSSKMLLISDPRGAKPFVDKAKENGTKIYYDRSDDWSNHKDQNARDDEKYVLDNCDYAFYSSRSLGESLPERLKENSMFVPNGATFYPIDEKIAKHERKTAVYLGNNYRKVSFTFLKQLAEKNPDWDIEVFMNEFCMQETPKNLIQKTAMPEEAVFDELLRCNVGLICPVLSDWSSAQLPQKLFQYTSAKLPVYYFNCPECENYPDIAFDSQKYMLDEVGKKIISDEIYDKYKDSMGWSKMCWNMCLELAKINTESNIDELIQSQYHSGLHRLNVGLTGWCNLDCPSCLQHVKQKNFPFTPKEQVKDTLDKIYDLIEQLPEYEMELSMIGGEISFYPLHEMLTEKKYPKNLKRLTITTNFTAPISQYELLADISNDQVNVNFCLSYHNQAWKSPIDFIDKYFEFVGYASSKKDNIAISTSIYDYPEIQLDFPNICQSFWSRFVPLRSSIGTVKINSGLEVIPIVGHNVPYASIYSNNSKKITCLERQQSHFKKYDKFCTTDACDVMFSLDSEFKGKVRRTSSSSTCSILKFDNLQEAVKDINWQFSTKLKCNSSHLACCGVVETYVPK